MPAKQTKQKIQELIVKNKRVLPAEDKAGIMESVVYELAEFFEVSIQAAKIRMIDLGYSEAIGVYTYLDDRYVKSHAFEKSALQRNQTFSIGVQDALIEYAMNLNFRKLLDSGKYIYIDSHFCINDSKYIHRDENGYPELTEYARQHIDECCLIFDIKAQANSQYGVNYYRECVLFRNAVAETITEVKYGDIAHNQGIEARAVELKRFNEEVKNTTKILRLLPATFPDTLVAHMDRLKISVETLAERSLLSPKTIQRMRNEDKQNNLQNVIAVCIGLQLNPVLSEDLIRKSGNAFIVSEEHITYKMILQTCYQSSIYECNEILKATNCKLLGREQ